MSWKTVKLGDICDLVNGKAFKPSDWSENGIRIVRIQNLNDPSKDFNFWGGSLNKQVAIDDGDLLLAWSGTPGTSFGAHIWSRGKAILNQHIFRIDLRKDIIDTRWAKVSVNYQLNHLIDQAHGGVGLQHVTKPMVENLDIPLPPLSIQTRIVSILEKADAAREKRRQANRLTEQFLQSAFLEMFGDPRTNPKKWDLRTLAELAKADKYAIKRGPFGGSLKKNIFVKEGYLVYEQYHAINDDFSFGRYFINGTKYKEMEMFKALPGDLIISCSGSLGQIAELPKDAQQGIINQALLKLSLDQSKVLNCYFIFLFRHSSTQDILFDVSRGSGIPNFPPMSTIKSIKFPIPPMREQVKYAALLEEARIPPRQAARVGEGAGGVVWKPHAKSV